jgi:hypothetical protein
MERWSPLAQVWRALPLRKHSNEAKKRLFRSRRTYEEIIKPRLLNPPAPEPLKYQPTYTPERWLPNGWSPPPPEGLALPRDSLPFQVGGCDSVWLGGS